MTVAPPHGGECCCTWVAGRTGSAWRHDAHQRTAAGWPGVACFTRLLPTTGFGFGSYSCFVFFRVCSPRASSQSNGPCMGQLGGSLPSHGGVGVSRVHHYLIYCTASFMWTAHASIFAQQRLAHPVLCMLCAPCRAWMLAASCRVLVACAACHLARL